MLKNTAKLCPESSSIRLLLWYVIKEILRLGLYAKKRLVKVYLSLELGQLGKNRAIARIAKIRAIARIANFKIFEIMTKVCILMLTPFFLYIYNKVVFF